MKNYVRMLLAATLITGSVNAQHVNIGIKGGLNVYSLKSDNGLNYDSKLGFNAGLLGHIHLTKMIALQPEIVYSAEGAKSTSAGVESKVSLGYINVPVLVQYMFDNGFRLQLGPQVGFLTSAKTETNNVTSDIKDKLTSADFSISGGVGYVHPASGIGVDARYNLGVSNINKNSNVTSNNRGFQLGVFYLFGHK